MKLDRKRLSEDPLGTIQDALMTEAQFLEAVIALAKSTGWVVAHFRPARTERGWRTAVQGDGVGFPDIILVREARDGILAIELKSENGKCSDAQANWLRLLGRVSGVRAFVFRPSDWDTLVSLLKGEK